MTSIGCYQTHETNRQPRSVSCIHASQRRVAFAFARPTPAPQPPKPAIGSSSHYFIQTASLCRVREIPCFSPRLKASRKPYARQLHIQPQTACLRNNLLCEVEVFHFRNHVGFKMLALITPLCSVMPTLNGFTSLPRLSAANCGKIWYRWMQLAPSFVALGASSTL